MQIVMNRDALNRFLRERFVQVADAIRVEAVTETGALVRLAVDASHLRPGGTVSGPAMFGLADVAIYLAILSRIGPVELAVTTNASIDFMRKPAAGQDLLAEVRLLKLGRQLAVGDSLIRSEGADQPVARCSMTYALPAQKP